MKILHISLDINPVRGGPPRSVPGLCKALAGLGHEVSLFVHDGTGADTADLGNVRLFVGTGRGLCGHWRADVRKVLDEVCPDIVHLHEVWGLSLHMDEVECRKRGIPYVIAPRGSLDPWGLKRKALKKKIALWLYQRRDLELASAIHATCEMEARYARAAGSCDRFIISPNGVNRPERLPPHVCVKEGERRFLFLARISPKKGLIDLVRAWKTVKRDGWILEIVGNDSEGYGAVVDREIARLGVGDSIIKTPYLDNVKKWDAYARADVFVLPTYTENFGIVVAEAMYSGLPVITTKGAPWKCLEEQNAGWWIDIGEKPLGKALVEAMDKTDEERSAMGERGREYVLREFDWKKIAAGLAQSYESLLESLRTPKVDLTRYRNRHPLKNLAARFLWQFVWGVCASWTPRYVLNGWRRLLLRMFGAKIGKGCRLTSSMEVWTPSRLFMGNSVWIDRNAYLYDVERITIGDNAIVSEGAFICTAGHDITKIDFPLTVAPVEIGAGAWVAARAIVLPGVKIGEGAVVAAGAVVSKDVEPWTVVAGNPARPVKKREVVPSGT